jgi:hypothetical protein
MALLLADVKFVFRARVVLRRARKPSTSTFMAKAPIEVEQIGLSEMQPAYSVGSRGGRGGFKILMHGGRLYWPALCDLGGHAGTVETRLRRLLSWRWDATSANGEEREPREPEADLSWRSMEESGEKQALTLLHRRAAACLVVDGYLYAEGGVPLASCLPGSLGRELPVLSTGTSRALDPGVAGLGWQPGAFHLMEAQLRLATGAFDVPYPGKEARGLVAHAAFAVDPLQVRLDATFRIAWHALWAPPRKRRTGMFSSVVDRFVAAESAGATELTARRHGALLFMLERIDGLGLGCPVDSCVSATLEAMNSAGAEADTDFGLTSEEIGALALLAG